MTANSKTLQAVLNRRQPKNEIEDFATTVQALRADKSYPDPYKCYFTVKNARRGRKIPQNG